MTLLLALLLGCRSREAKINAIEEAIEMERLDRDLLALAKDSLYSEPPLIRKKYGHFFECYNTGVIQIGNSRDTLYGLLLQRFMHHEAVRVAYEKVSEVFADGAMLDKELTDAFKHVKYYFPSLPTPRIIAYVSGFNQSLMLTDSAVGVGLDRFLGNGFDAYNKVGIDAYLQYNMRPERIPAACVQAWLMGEYVEPQGREKTLLAQMLYEGKLLYVLQQCFPEEPMALLAGFTPEQMQWCVNNEKQMWQYLIEQQVLYTTNSLTIRKYTSDAPFTVFFSQESPGKAVNWLGSRIVAGYVKRTGCSLVELMQQQDASLLLKEARYNP